MRPTTDPTDLSNYTSGSPVDSGGGARDNFGMKAVASESLVVRWPHGILAEVMDGGVLLKPRPKPRQGWAKSFRRAKVADDETAALRSVKNKFDAAEWEW
jgi:hypothetical protein